MSELEPFWIPDSDVSPEKKNRGGGKGKTPRSDRKEHSNTLRESFAKAVQTSSSSPSSFQSSGITLMVVEMNDVYNRKNAANRREDELSSLGMEVKAVIDNNHILVALRNQTITGIGPMIDQYGTTEIAGTEPKPSVLDEIAGFCPNVGSGKCSEDVLDGGNSAENVILMIVPNMEESDYDEAFPAIRKRVQSLGGSVNEESADNIAMPYISVTLPSEEAVLSMCDDQAIYRVDSDGEASLDAFFPNPGLPQDLEPCFDHIGTKPVVCIIDGGFHDNKFLGPLLLERYHPEVPAHGNHGTMVASRAAYEYIKPADDGTLIPACRLIDANIFREGIKETELVTLIRDVVERYHDVCKIYNICINIPTRKVGKPSPLSVTIDDLQRSFDVTFVSSSGNVLEYIDKGSLEDVLNDDAYWLEIPAQSVYALTVGAIAHRGVYGGLSGINQIVPYSRHGPGISNTVKPDLLAYSANVDYFDGKKAYLYDDMSRVLGDDGPVNVQGTSFSAPVVSNHLSQVMDRFRGLRSRACCALMINVCEPVSLRGTSRNRVGFGSTTLENCLTQFPWRTTFIREAKIGEDGKKVHFIRLPVPECLEDRDCTITVTCLSDPELNASQNQSYLLSNLSVTMQRMGPDGKYTDDNKVREREKLSKSMDPCQMKIYKFSGMDAKELRLRIASTVNPMAESLEVKYTLVVTIEEDSRSIDVFEAVRGMNHYRAVSEILKERISDRQTIAHDV